MDEVIWILPRAFPHKEYFGATLQQRIELLEVAQQDALPGSIAIAEGGLFVDIARECRGYYRDPVKLSVLCGADAAERIVNWDYGEPGFVEKMLQEFDLLVAARGQEYEPPAGLRQFIAPLHIGDRHHDVSSTEVRERIQRAQPWEHLVPPSTVARVREIYS